LEVTREVCGCIRLNALCEFTAPYRRGRPPNADSHRSCPQSKDRLPQPLSTENEDATGATGQSQGSSRRILAIQETIMPATEPPSRASPDIPVTDLQGHYIGPASGVSFLHRVQQRLHMNDHSSPSFTFGDTPLPEFDPANFVVMVSKEETRHLVQKFFDFSVPIDRLFHKPTIEAWLEEFHDTMGAMVWTNEAPARRAVLWMIFAIAQGHFNDTHSANERKRCVPLSFL
jgi:hypothetical protein